LTKEQKEKAELEKQKRKLEKEKEKKYENELKEKIKRDKESKRRELESSSSTPKSPSNQTPFSSLPNNNKKQEEKKEVLVEKEKKVNVNPKEEKKTYTTTEIAFRLPDGEVVKCGFKPSDLLSECREFVNSNFKAKKYEMLCVFPRRTYNAEDLTKSLQKLNLVPNGTIILSPGSSFVSPNNTSQQSPSTTVDPNAGGGFLSSICPDSVSVVFTSFYDSVMGLFGSTQQVPTTTTTPQTQQQRVTPTTTTPKRETQKKDEQPQDNPRTVVRRGNVHRFEDKEDETKKEKFNNGNSTQFQDE
jgi:hypothetical protein